MNVRRAMAGCLASLAMTAGARAGISNLITNGSFETPVIPSASFEQFPTSIPGWTGSAGIEIQSNGVLGPGAGTPFGNQYAELAVVAPSTYSQTVSTVSGTQYALSFYFADRPDSGTDSIVVGFTGNPDMTVTLNDTGTVSFQQFTETFTATASQSTLSFAPVNLAVPGIGDLLDNVSLTGQTAPASSGAAASAIPLPAAFWTGLSGLLGLGVILRRSSLRRRTS